MRRLDHISRPVRFRRACALILLALVMALSGAATEAAGGQKNTAKKNPAADLQRVEKKIEKSRRVEQDLRREAARISRDQKAMQRRLIRMAKDIQGREDRLNAGETRVRDLSKKESRLARDLLARRQDLSHILGGLSRLERDTAIVLIAGPGRPIENLRSSILLAAIAPELERRAAQIRDQIETLRRLRGEIAEERDGIRAARRELKRERQKMAGLLAKKSSQRRALTARAEDEHRRLATLIRSADSLRDLVERLDQDRQSPRHRQSLEHRIDKLRKPAVPAPRGDGDVEKKSRLALAKPPAAPMAPEAEARFRAARGRLPLPARGRLIGRFGKRNAYGHTTKGITLATREFAQVVAPFDGEVAYAGEFRGYGRLLIIAHGGGYHSLLAGLSRIHVVVGQLLLANEPVGEMGGGENGNPKLYVELRYRGVAINPLPWLAVNTGKVKG